MDRVQAFFATEPGYVVLLFTLLVLPRLVVRWRLPTAITAFGLGALAGLGFDLFAEDQTVHLLSTFGIVALFLFAGLDVDAADLARRTKVLVQHLVIRVLLLAVATVALARWLDLAVRPAVLVALALLTPSTGFILDSLRGFGLSAEERLWVRSKAIATELLALTVLFVVLQSASWPRLALATLALIALVAMLPAVFRFFAARVAPYAPTSEFAFLLMMAVLCAYATRRLGVYYLVGAFVVGVAGRRFRTRLPAMASEQMLHAIEVFASFFIPFYFFSAGTSLRRGEFTVAALVLGVAFVGLAVPLRIASIALHRRLALGERLAESIRVATPLMPTLVFTLVIVGILRERYELPAWILGALVIYTVVNTLVPGFALGLPAPAFDAPGLPAQTGDEPPAVSPAAGSSRPP